MKKRIMATLLVVVMVVGLLPAPSRAASDFTISNGVLTKYNGSGGKVTIPSGVSSIGSRAFSSCTKVTSVTIPSGVTSIGDHAFNGCTGLTSVSLSSRLISIGDYAFSNCTGLTSISLPSSLTSLGGSAFYCCSGLTRVSVPSGVTSIEAFTFYNCSALSSVTLPNNLTGIGNSAFAGCTSLKTIAIPSKVTSIGNSAFKETGLTGVNIPGSVTSIGESAFQSCADLTAVTIEPGARTVTARSVGGHAFQNCTRLKTLNLPWGMTTLGEYAFSYCRALTSVTIPETVTKISQCLFYYCTGLTSMEIPEDTTYMGSGVFTGCDALSRLFIPASVTSFAYTFSLPSATTVYGFTGSTAESVCETNNIPFVPVEATVSFDLATPASFEDGTDVTLEGTVTSEYSALRSVKLDVLYQDPQTQMYQVKLSATDSFNSTYAYEIDARSKLNAQLALDELTPGTYYIRCTATLKKGFTSSGRTGTFTVTPSYCTLNGHTEGDPHWAGATHPHDEYCTCAVCGRAFVLGIMESWSAWRTVKAPTCTQSGLERRTCQLGTSCPEKQENPLPALGHNWTDRQDAPTCTAAGRNYKECSRCHATSQVTVLPALGHVYAPAVTATETVYTCSQCQEESYTSHHGPAGTAQSGYLVSPGGDRLPWSITAEGQITLGASLPQGERVLVGCYNEKGSLLSVQTMDTSNTEAQISPSAPQVKLFWLDSDQIPLSFCETVWAL